MSGENPCNACKAEDMASKCAGCVFDTIAVCGECGNDKCFLHYECGCLCGLDEECKASTAYVDKLWLHECSECVRFTKRIDGDGCEYFTCGDGAQIGEHDDTCDNFKERSEVDEM